ncbi:hypothetical protein [Hymenobacter edaphi]|uniref:Uncharacterized protein n=1 Tax=Hymenobacter edaphi TaxID=2211146 RepID=A0A328BTL5_9BACT|nr:hypothetical protein [Hymenobacter edaphi]RAK69871.1 hypothetical protein DLM85_03170 [Hymenobacter edaphi]
MPHFSPPVRRFALLAALAAAGLSTPACQSGADSDVALLRLRLVDDALLAGNNEALHANEGTVKLLHALTERNRNAPADVVLLGQAEAVHDSTRALVGHLRDVREQLLRRTDNHVHFKHLNELRAVASLLPGGEQGAAGGLQRRLTRHARLLGQVVPDRRAAAKPLHADFAAASVASALAALARLEAGVLLRETEALASLQARVGPTDLPVTARAWATAEARTVAPGSTYKAELYLAQALYRPGHLTMTANGQPVSIDAGGFGRVAFTAPALGGALRRQLAWEGTVRVRLAGHDTTFRVRVPYTVVRRR